MENEAPFLLSFLSKPLSFITENSDYQNTLVMTWVVSLIVMSLCLLGTRKLKKIPDGLQNVFELFCEALETFATPIIGKNTRFFLPLLGTLGIFILVSNLLGLVPGLKAATSNWNTTIALAIIVFLSTHFFGIKKKGVKYFKHFLFPIRFAIPPKRYLIPLTLPAAILTDCIFIFIHLIGEIAKPFSLSIRLFANMMAKHLIIGSLSLLVVLFSYQPKLFLVTGCIPLILPPFIFILGVLTCLIQTFIFVLLTTIYIGTAIEEHEEE